MKTNFRHQLDQDIEKRLLLKNASTSRILRHLSKRLLKRLGKAVRVYKGYILVGLVAFGIGVVV